MQEGPDDEGVGMVLELNGIDESGGGARDKMLHASRWMVGQPRKSWEVEVENVACAQAQVLRPMCRDTVSKRTYKTIQG